MSIIISYQETHLDLPYMPGEGPDEEGALPEFSEGDSAGPSTMTTDNQLPSFEEVVREQRSLNVEFTPIVTVKYTKTTRVQRMTTTLVRHVIEQGTSLPNETVAQWDLFSGKMGPVEGPIKGLTQPVTIDPSIQKYTLQCSLPARLAETASHKSNRLWYTLDTHVSCNKWRLSWCGVAEHSEEIVVARSRQSDHLSHFPVSVSMPWLNKLKFSITYPQKHIALHEGTEIPVKITTTLFEKPIRLNSVKFAVLQTCNSNTEETQKTGLLTVYSNRYRDSDLVEYDKIELNDAREEGFGVKENFLDSIHMGNLLIPGAEETVLDYTLKLSARAVETLSASTSCAHPFHMVHKLFTSLRFSQLDLTDQPNQKSRRYVDLAVSTPLVFSRATSVFETGTSPGTAPFDYDDFLLCEYPRLKDTVFTNDFANDSAPSYESLAPPDYDTATARGAVRSKCCWFRR